MEFSLQNCNLADFLDSSYLKNPVFILRTTMKNLGYFISDLLVLRNSTKQPGGPQSDLTSDKIRL